MLRHVTSALDSVRTSRWASIRSIRSVWQRIMTIHPDVESALAVGRPVIAMETTIVTHGMPFPDNVQTALRLEEIARSYDVTPATIGLVDGRVVVGLTPSQLERLGQASEQEKKFKVSRRDLSYVLSQGYSGGTTVSGTMVCAHMAGIPLFVTGGIGGVHREGERTLDISADLTELGRTPVSVVCAGAKSILDIGKTLEYLETQGVTVASYGETRDFPAFFSPKSGFEAPCSVSNPIDAAKLIDTNLTLGIQNGVLIGVPIPNSDGSCHGDEIEAATQQALFEAKESGVSGKLITPFLLERVNQLTSGKSLEVNIKLIENNTRIGSQIAVELAKLRKKGQSTFSLARVRSNSVHGASSKCKKMGEANDRNNFPQVPMQPVVIGASILDFTAKVDSREIRLEGTNPGSLVLTYGGVGRNIAETMTRLGCEPLLVTSVGSDESGGILTHQFEQIGMTTVGVCSSSDFPTATYCVVLDQKGELFCGVGDMDVNQCISMDWVKQFTEQLLEAPFVCLDGNVPNNTIEYVCNLCSNAAIPVWFEPTCLDKSIKPFHIKCHSKITYTSPNLSELRNMSNILTNRPTSTAISSDLTTSEKISECLELVPPLLMHIPNILVSLGKDGVLCCSASDPNYVHYPPAASHLLPVGVVSVTGAGDSFVGSTIVALVQGLTLDLSIKAGLRAAYSSIRSQYAVSPELSPGMLTYESISEWAPWEPTIITPQ